MIEFVDSKDSDSTASEDAAKRKPGQSYKSDDKKPGRKRDKEQGKDAKKSQETSEGTDSSSDEDKKDADPEWKLLEEQAENVNDGNDEEEDNPVTINTVKYVEID